MDEVGDADGWRCWLCDEPVDRTKSVNDDRGPSVDSRMTSAKAKAKSKSKNGTPEPLERIAHRACNTKKGAVAAVVSWHPDLFVVDPAPIIGSVERLLRKGGREIMARCPTRADADQAATWLVDRLSRLVPDGEFTTAVESGGGQCVVVLIAAR